MTDYDAKCYVLTEYLRCVQSKIIDGYYDTLINHEDDLSEFFYCDIMKDSPLFNNDSNGKPLSDNEILYWKKIFKHYCKKFISERKLDLRKVESNRNHRTITTAALVRRIKEGKTNDND